MIMRVFIAMDVKDEGSIANMLKVQREFTNLVLNAKPVSKEQLHFTLLFLGEIDSSMLERVKERLSKMIFEPVNVVYRGVGAFPSMRHPRIIWVGVDPNTTSKLIDIARGVEDRLEPLGFKSDKQFTPHITLLRVKEGNSSRRSRRSEDLGGDALATAICKHSSTYFGSDTLDEIKVKKSDLMREGPIYTDMFSIKASSRLGSK